ncbi:MAG: hypothetical protein ABIU54_08155 [Candidatus Eisenbacteria bacterium]
MKLTPWLAIGAAIAVACSVAARPGAKAIPTPVPPTAVLADTLIRKGEGHFEHLYQLTFGGQNAEAYWSADGQKLIMQITNGEHACDQEYVFDMRTGARTLVSTGKGRTTCGYFYDHDERVLFASTHLGGGGCPPNPDMSKGYVWPVYASYEIFTARTDGTDLRQLTVHPGYDAEGTVSADGRWLIFTSKRDGDIDLYKMRLDGSKRTRLTNTPGYDGGAFFSHDGKRIVWRTHRTDDTTLVHTFQRLLVEDLVKPSKMDIWVMDADGRNPKRLTDRPGASFAPCFTPDDRHIIYASNWTNPRGRNFDLWLIPVNGGEPVQVTTDTDFDGFPMFSPDGHTLVFCSNRGGSVAGETNVFLAKWRD